MALNFFHRACVAFIHEMQPAMMIRCDNHEITTVVVILPRYNGQRQPRQSVCPSVTRWCCVKTAKRIAKIVS